MIFLSSSKEHDTACSLINYISGDGSLFMELADMIREPSPEILYKNLKKKWLAHVRASQLSRLGAEFYFVITFVDILPPLSSNVVLIGYVEKPASYK